MIVRGLDANNDWTFGRGKNNYLFSKAAIGQSIKTRLSSFLGDCFFDTGAGIDWFNLLGSKKEFDLTLAIRAVIFNTPGVTRLLEVSTVLDQNRNLRVEYSVTVVAPSISSNTVIGSLNFLLDESGNILTDESGSGLVVES